MAPLQPPLLCLVTNPSSAGTGRTLELIREAADAGIDLVQIRSRELDDRAVLALTRAAVNAVLGTRARVVVNERLDVALAAGAHGVHLRGDSVAAPAVRRHSPPGFVVGRSVHGRDEAVLVADAGGCDYLLFGTVFPSMSKPEGHSAQGVAALREVCASVRLPVLAIGGISVERAPEVSAAGAAGVAAIGLFAGTESVARTIEALRRAFDTRS